MTRASRRRAGLALGLALIAALAPVTTANAATPPAHNVVRGFCLDDQLARDCVLHADDDTGDLTVRNHGGHVVHLPTVGAAKRYFRVHATPCRLEDSDDCFWDASRRGDHRGASFITVDGITLPLWLFV